MVRSMAHVETCIAAQGGEDGIRFHGGVSLPPWWDGFRNEDR